MKLTHAARTSPWRAALLAVVLSGAVAASASAAVSALTLDPTGRL